MLEIMVKRIILIIVIVVGGLLVWRPSFLHDGANKIFSSVSTASLSDAVPVDGISSVGIIEATNKERVAAGLAPLSTNKKLNSSAAMKVDDMITLQYFEHQSPRGEGVSDLGSKAGYQYVIMGENLALGDFDSSSGIVQAWMDSPGHRANILNKKYQDIGVSVKRGMYEGKEVWFAVQHFGTQRVVCPPIDAGLKSDIDAINLQLKQEEGLISELRRQLEAPGAQNDPAYKETISSFNKYVDQYNAKLSTSREKISSYNDQVKSFNTCIATFQ